MKHDQNLVIATKTLRASIASSSASTSSSRSIAHRRFLATPSASPTAAAVMKSRVSSRLDDGLTFDDFVAGDVEAGSSSGNGGIKKVIMGNTTQ
jgi:hypothetical protein